MPRYVFSNGKVTVEDGVYAPSSRSDKPRPEGVLIFPPLLCQNERQESKKDRGESHVQKPDNQQA